MNALKFRKIQKLMGMNRPQIAKLLECSISTIEAYRSESEKKNRNMPRLVEKYLMAEFEKRGGNIEDLMECEDGV